MGSARCQPLKSLAGTSVADRFRTWTGLSGRRYVFSVYALGQGGVDEETGLLSGEAVVIGVQKTADDRCVPHFVAVTTGVPDLLSGGGRVTDLRRHPGSELHLHLTAADAAERRRIAADLSAG